MARSNDIVFMAEYIKNVLYFATVRHDKGLKSTQETHYFSIDDELIYENYYSDFGPLNLGCVYRYCKILNEKFRTYLHKQAIVHYTLNDPKKKANAAFLLGCYGVLHLSLSPKDALKPLMERGASYRPFQDATQGDSEYTITIMDCLKAIKKASELGFFNFKDFDYDEYDKYDKLTGGDLNWIVPGKFLAFIGPVDSNFSLCHPPEMYIEYFLENEVKAVVRLNKRFYDGNVFNNAGITHHDLFFPDGSVPPRHILFKFLQISEDTDGAIAVHCKAGLGRTGSLIGCYLIKHYRMTAHEAIGWMRICRPGSVIGQQQGWLEQMEPWLIKQGNIYRKRLFHDTEKIKVHEFGVYSIAERSMRRRGSVVFQRTPSPPPPLQRSLRSVVSPPPRPQASRFRADKRGTESEEVFLRSYDLTVKPKKAASWPLMKDNSVITVASLEGYGDNREENDERSKWRKYLCCQPCKKICKDNMWMLAVRCVKITPKKCRSTWCCSFLDVAAPAKIEKDFKWRAGSSKTAESNLKVSYRGDHSESPSNSARRSGAGDPRTVRPLQSPRTNTKPQARSTARPIYNDSNVRNLGELRLTSPVRAQNAPLVKSVNNAQNFLIRSPVYKDNQVSHLNSAITVTPHFSYRVANEATLHKTPGSMAHKTPSSFSSVSQGTTQTQQRQRQRLGRSPSPPRSRIIFEKSKATNTPTPSEQLLSRDASKIALKAALSRLKVVSARDDSVGAASIGAGSLGARREAPAPARAPSVRSDDRPLATQGDMLNSIKLQRRFRDTLDREKFNKTFNEKFSTSKDKNGRKRELSIKNVSSKTSTGNKAGLNQHYVISKEKPGAGKGFQSPTRPLAPKGRRNVQNPFH